MKLIMSSSWTSPNFKETNCLPFFKTVGSSSRSFTRIGNRYDLIRLLPYFALLNPKTGKTLQYRSKCSCVSINWIFCICRNCVVKSFSSSSTIQSSTKFDTLAARLRLWLLFQFSTQFYLDCSLYFNKIQFHLSFAWSCQYFENGDKRQDEMMRIGVAEKNGFPDQVWRNRNQFRHVLPNLRCSLSLLVGVFFDRNGLKVKYCQVPEQFLLLFIWDFECIQLFKKDFSQFVVNILWVIMLNTITTSKYMS